jgi:hypothetical protein
VNITLTIEQASYIYQLMAEHSIPRSEGSNPNTHGELVNILHEGFNTEMKGK